MRVSHVETPAEARFCAGCRRFQGTPGKEWRVRSREGSEASVYLCTGCLPRTPRAGRCLCGERVNLRKLPLCAPCLSDYEWARLINTERF